MSNTVQKYVQDARKLYEALNGIFILYKPTSSSFSQMRATVISKLCTDLNNQRVRPPMQHIAIEGPTNQFMKVVVRENYADNVLVVGPRYQPNDFRLSATKLTGKDTSGVMVCGINNGNKFAHKLRNAKCTRFYKVKGILGQATDNYFYTGKIAEKSTYKHVKHGHIDRVCSSMQSTHQRKMFELCGIDMQTQAAYELAVKGLLRPSDPNIPMIYTIRCVHFTPPEFTLEIVCINEYEMYLKTIVHDIGMQLRSTATCTQILCIQDGLFTLEHALLTKHWDLVSILSSISVCDKILAENKDLLYQQSPTLVEYDSTSKYVPFKKESSQI